MYFVCVHIFLIHLFYLVLFMESVKAKSKCLLNLTVRMIDETVGDIALNLINCFMFSICSIRLCIFISLPFLAHLEGNSITIFETVHTMYIFRDDLLVDITIVNKIYRKQNAKQPYM